MFHCDCSFHMNDKNIIYWRNHRIKTTPMTIIIIIKMILKKKLMRKIMILSLLWNGIHFQLCRLCVCICYKSNEWIAACHPFHFVGFIFLYSHWSLIISYIDKWQEYSESDKWFWLHTHTHTILLFIIISIIWMTQYCSFPIMF